MTCGGYYSIFAPFYALLVRFLFVLVYFLVLGWESVLKRLILRFVILCTFLFMENVLCMYFRAIENNAPYIRYSERCRKLRVSNFAT